MLSGGKAVGFSALAIAGVLAVVVFSKGPGPQPRSEYKQASIARAKGDWREALAHANRVGEADPDFAAAQVIAVEARDAAKDLYLLGYVEKDKNPAKAEQLFAQVTQIMPADDEFARKAQHQLDSLRH